MQCHAISSTDTARTTKQGAMSSRPRVWRRCLATPSDMDHPHDSGGAQDPSHGAGTAHQHHAPVHKEAADGQVHDSGAGSVQLKHTANAPPAAV
ncbi:hypothetical protein PR202_gb03991 [Eleusine coracana subsp. coracana]|uniref:Uncharacterized protein n=1 Tax=Eleusine coracana subsp. coracana TaxID=191504 RepID=A0AAV5E487_ELECO|nr:hypothetical protein PR202_gb03991 [Eleusine coracana subsp. coracana]